MMSEQHALGAREDREVARLALQDMLDRGKTPEERNQLGQFATPTALATDILQYAAMTPDLRNTAIRFLDPAIGTGSFYAALLRCFPRGHIARAEGFEVDPWYGERAREFWAGTALTIHLADFTRAAPPTSEAARFNLLICNPPYVRHHHLTNDEKQRLHASMGRAIGMRLSGLAGLYCYILLLAHQWMATGGYAGWLIPSEFMDVNYGRAVKDYLLRHVRLLRIHRFDPSDVQFTDALVSSAVVWFQNAPPAPDQEVEFTFGGTVAQPRVRRAVQASALDPAAKWTGIPLAADAALPDKGAVLSDLFQVRRGLATGDNSFFVLTREQAAARDLPSRFLTPILPPPRELGTTEVLADSAGEPLLARRLYLLNCNLPEHYLQREYPALWAYLQEGVASGISTRYLCLHRTPWYAQESRPPAPFLSTYMGRRTGEDRAPFRFILNHSRATAANVYLMLYPREPLKRSLARDPGLLHTVWQALQALTPETLIGEGRVYGGGLHKMEPRELGNAPADAIVRLLHAGEIGQQPVQLSFGALPG